MYVFDYHHVKKFDEQRRRRSLARFEALRSSETQEGALPVADVIEMTFPEDCLHTEQLGA